MSKGVKINLHKIIFLDELAYELLKDYENDFTKIIKINKNDFYLFNLQDEITNFELYTNNKDKDTLEYILTQCSKTEWIRKAIENDGFNELNNYIWIDNKELFSCYNSDHNNTLIDNY